MRGESEARPSPPEGAGYSPPRSTPPGARETEEGSHLFHVALAFGLIPGVSSALAVIGWARLRTSEPRWARRIVALALLDLAVFLAVGAAMVVTATQLAPTLGEALSAPGGAPSAASPLPSLGPRPRIGIVLEDATGGGAEVIDVATGSPAESAGVEDGDVITALDEVPMADRDALIAAISTGPADVSRRLAINRAGQPLTLEVTPITGPFPPMPLDAQTCVDAMPDSESTLEGLRSPETLVTLGVIALVLLGLFGWGARKGLPARESAKVLLPFVAILFVGPSLGRLLAALACPALVSLDIRFETVEIVLSEVVLLALALGLLYAHRGLGAGLSDETPRYGFWRTLGQAVLYAFAWMPRALLLTTPIAVLFFADGALDEAPVAQLVSGAGRTPLDAALTFVAAALLAPVAEESLFRGVLAPHLARLTAAFPAVLVTAAIFGVLHVGGHGPLFVGPMFLGAILGWARLRARSLGAPIALHVLLNSTAMTLALALGVE